MNLLNLLAIAFGLAMDACAVAIATSVMLQHVRKRQIFRFAFHFGLFQALMPILGWLAGQSFARYISSWDHWAAFCLLAIIGGRAVYEALKNGCEELKQADPTRGWMMIGLAIATSLDALVVGVSFALLGLRIWYPAAVIGVVTAILVVIAMLLGIRLNRGRERWMKLAGGIVLIVIGIKILIEDLIANHHMLG